jgi:hypothetical protein
VITPLASHRVETKTATLQLDAALQKQNRDQREFDCAPVLSSTYRGSFPANSNFSGETTADDWSAPTNLGPLVNSPATDARATLSRDGLTMYFNSTRAGGLADIYVTSRKKLTGNNH